VAAILAVGELIRLAVLVVEVLKYAPRVVDDLVTVDEHGNPVLARELDDLRAVAAPVGEALGAVLDPELSQPALDSAAWTKDVRGRAAAVQDDRIVAGFAGGTHGRALSTTRMMAPRRPRRGDDA